MAAENIRLNATAIGTRCEIESFTLFAKSVSNHYLLIVLLQSSGFPQIGDCDSIPMMETTERLPRIAGSSKDESPGSLTICS